LVFVVVSMNGSFVVGRTFMLIPADGRFSTLSGRMRLQETDTAPRLAADRGQRRSTGRDLRHAQLVSQSRAPHRRLCHGRGVRVCGGVVVGEGRHHDGAPQAVAAGMRTTFAVAAILILILILVALAIALANRVHEKRVAGGAQAK
jgi:hypothetical protein